mmetsp:Transcript_41795/g.133355  ORF Transcript_41795/g.133355 Transcript_41795/m.133355 type:complete len:88 (+) Transcript_41795:253-516(+)
MVGSGVESPNDGNLNVTQPGQSVGENGETRLPGEAGMEPDGTPMERCVSWQDMFGKDLTTVREFEPSDTEESEMSEEDEKKSCCVIS